MKRLTITFDNGPVPGATEKVLAALAERQVTATFFMVGRRILGPKGRQSAMRVRQAGHRIGNHTMSHGAPLGDSGDPRRVAGEIGGAERALDEVAARELLFRPNGRGEIGPHLLSGAAVEYLVAHRYTVVLWNCVPRDWEPPSGGWVRRAHEAIARQDWTVLVLHDVNPESIDHVPGFLDTVLAEGVELRRDFPPSCVPILEGRLQWPIEGVIANGYDDRLLTDNRGPTVRPPPP